MYKGKKNIWEGGGERDNITSPLILLIFYIICQYILTAWWKKNATEKSLIHTRLPVQVSLVYHMLIVAYSRIKSN